MLTILDRPSNKSGFCDGLSRRNFIRIGGLGLGALSLPQLLRAVETAGNGKGSSHKAVIMIFLAGGPPHQDMWDIKTEAPSNVRGEFSPISTEVDGIQIGELFPRIAKTMKDYTVIRSMVGATGGHDAHQCLTGRSNRNMPPAGWPCIGSVLSKLKGPLNEAIPPAFGLSLPCSHQPWGDNGSPGFLGQAFKPITPSGDGKSDMVLNGVTLDRLEDRKELLSAFDKFRRDSDASGTMDGLDAFNEQAFGLLTSSKLLDALDISKADPKLRERYGKGTDKPTADGPPKLLDQFLVARRLVSAGARCVTVAFSRWDWHGNNFGRAREDFPMLDQGVTALVEDLKQRDMLDDVSVVVWGEFGRTPTINGTGGRDHWPKVSTALLAGGGMNTGQVIGATDRLGGEAADRPVKFGEVFATLYHNLGIDVNTATVEDLTGRPHYLVDDGIQPMRELV